MIIPLFTIVMPVYNSARYLKSSIDSILEQTFKDFEFIIINDGSTDNTGNILKEYLSRDNRIVLVQQERKGVSKSLNEGIKIAKGKFIARQDADDISCINRIERQLYFLEANHEYGLIGSNWNYIDERGNILETENKLFIEEDDEIRKNIVKFNPFCHSSIVFRKEVCNEVGFYNEKLKYAQDYEFWVRIMSHYKVANLNEVLVLKRIHHHAISTKDIKKQIFYSIKIKMFAIHYLSLPFFNYLSILDAISNIILPVSLSRKIERFKIALRDILRDIFKKLFNI